MASPVVPIPTTFPSHQPQKKKKQPKWNEGGNYNKTEEHVGVDVVFISFKYAGDSSKSHLFLKNGGRWG
jgi:hypothetical protein